MPSQKLIIDGRQIEPRKAIKAPEFKGRPIHVSSAFDYVDMWLKQQRGLSKTTRSYWLQAKDYYEASISISQISRPLTSYYCILNLSKTLLDVRRDRGEDDNTPEREQHGVTGWAEGERLTIANEMIEFKTSGVLARLSRYYGDNPSGTYALSDIFYNIPYIHRVFCMSAKSRNAELFIPIKNFHFRRIDPAREFFLSGTLTTNWANDNTIRKLPARFEVDYSSEHPYQIRYRRRESLRGRITTDENIEKLVAYNKNIRRRIFSIHDAPNVWYVKRGGRELPQIDKSPVCLTFAAMHRLSELSRYQPEYMAQYLESRYSTVISEFLNRSLDYFIDQVSCEITGHEIIEQSSW